MKKGKKVKGINYVEDDEKYDRKMKMKDAKNMSTAGFALNLKKSQKDEGYSKKPRVKPQNKNAKPVSGQKKVY